MDEMEFDKTRQAIGAQNLGQDDRKELLDRFKKSGGEVLREKAVGRPEEEKGKGGKSGRGGGGLSDTKLPSQIAREKKRQEAELERLKQKQKEAEEKEASSFFARLSIKIKCMLGGLTPFGSTQVLPKFLSRVNLDAKRALMECNILGNELLVVNAEVSRAIRKELAKKNPVMLELIQRSMELYDRVELNELVGGYAENPNAFVTLDAIRVPLFGLLRKLYYLKPFQETFLQAMELAIDIQQSVQKKQSELYSSKKKKFRQDWKTLMNSIYPSLVLLAQRAEMKKAEPGTTLFEDMIGVLEKDKVGRKKPEDLQTEEPAAAKPDQDKPSKTEDDEENKESEENKEAEEEEVKEIPKEIAYGMQLMKLRSVTKLRKLYDPKGDWKHLPDNDKVLLSILMLRFFEDQFGIILTTSQMKLNPKYHEGRKIDYREKLSDLVERARIPYESYRNYIHESTEYYKAVEDPSASMNYVEHSKKVQFHDNRRGGSGRETRVAIAEYMKNVSKALSELISDIRSGGSIVANPDEPMTIESISDEKMRLNGKKVKEGIMESYCFAYALANRIESGDLFGGVLEMSEEDFKAGFATG